MSQPLQFQLRHDLLITPVESEDQSQTTYMVKLPTTGEIFEFGVEEFFLCQCLDGEVTLASIIRQFETEFGLSISEEYLRQFLQQIGEFGLLEEVDFDRHHGLADHDESTLLPYSQTSQANYTINPPDSIRLTSQEEDRQDVRMQDLVSSSGPVPDDGSSSTTIAERSTATTVALTAEVASDQTDFGVSTENGGRSFQRSTNLDNDLEAVDTRGGSDRWYWGDPTPILKVIDFAFSPIRPFMRVYVWLLIPAVLAAVFLYFKNQDLMWQDVASSQTATPFILSILVNLVTTSLVSRLARGTVCHHFGGDVKEFGLKLRFGIILRFYIDASSTNRFDRRAKLWSYGTPILLRLSMFVGGMLLWFMTRSSGTALSWWGVSLAQSGLIGFIIVSVPIRTSPGYLWLVTFFKLPANLLKLSLAVFSATIRRRPLPASISTRERVLLFIYALVLLICWPLIAIRIVAKIGQGLAGSFPNIFGQATTAILVALAGVIVLRWLWINKIAPMTGRKKDKSNYPVEASKPWDLGQSQAASTPWLGNVKKLLLFGLLGLLGFVLISPFPYRPGGSVQLLPPEQQLIQAPVSGQVVAVNFEGGDGQWLNAGTVIASLASSDLQNQVTNLQEQIRQQQAEIEKRQAELAKIQAGPRSEEVEIARREVATARQEVEEAQKMLEVAQADADIARQQLETSQVRLHYNLEQVNRLENLYDQGAYSLQQLDEAKAQAEVSQGQVSEAQQALSRSQKQVETVRENLEIKRRQLESSQAQLNLVMGGARPEDIDIAKQDVSAAESELNALKQSLAFTQGKLGQADLLMPIDGYLTTPYLKQRVGSYVAQGETFATVQNNKVAIAELELPEYDSGGIEIGSPTLVKLLAYPNDPIQGQVMSIEPVTTEETYGNVLNILISLDASTQSLKPGMAGYAKINAGEKPLIYLLTRPIIRFVQIELWSWLP